MAFPNNIKSSGDLSIPRELAEYFRWSCGMQTVAPNNNTPLNDSNDEGWPFIIDGSPTYRQFMVQDETNNPSGINMYTVASTITRKQFYDYLDYWTVSPNYNPTDKKVGWFSTDIDGSKLYTYATPKSHTLWNVKQLNDWGKMKTLELMFFKSVANGGSLTDTIKISPNWLSTDAFYRLVNHTITTSQLPSSLFYLRCGLTRFKAYGDYKSDLVLGTRPAPTNLVADQNNRTFSFTRVPNFNDWNYYEYSYDGGSTWVALSSNTIPVSGAGVAVGGLLVRLASDGIFQAGNTVTNTEAISAAALNIEVNVTTYRMGAMEYSMYVNVDSDQILTTSVLINIILKPSTDYGVDTNRYFNIIIHQESNSNFDSQDIYEENGYGNINNVINQGITTTPSTYNGLPININYNYS